MPSLCLGYPEPGRTILYDDSELIELATVPLAGGTLLKTLVLSIDPYMRNLMNVSALWFHNPVFLGLIVLVVYISEGQAVCTFALLHEFISQILAEYSITELVKCCVPKIQPSELETTFTGLYVSYLRYPS